MNMRIKLLCIVCLLNIFWAVPVSSMPAFPGDISYVQPDGTVVKYRLKGDERRHWIESVDGHILKKAENGYLVYAENVNGTVAASSLPYTENDALAASKMKLLKRQNMSSPERISVSPSLQLEGTFPLTGKHKLLMLLVNYADTQTSFSREDFDDMMNEANYNGTGCFRDFYLENSYQQLDVETTVVGWIQLSKNKNMYSTEDMTDLISEALTQIQGTVDFSQFDNDGDGELDGLSIIHQGTGQEVSGSTGDIWSHSGELLDTWVDGFRVRTYTIQPELLFSAPQRVMMSVGVFCHEFGHNLGAPDFYDVDYETDGEFEGTGEWDLMAGGAWGTYRVNGDSPCHYNMWQKIQFGWVKPTILSSSTTVTDLPAASDEPVAYVLETMRDGDYFVLENRQQKKFDRVLPGHGLVVYHADENIIERKVGLNTVNADSEQGLYVVSASAGCLPDGTPSSYGNVNSSGTPFPGSTNMTVFSDATFPALHSNDGKYSYTSLSDITESNQLVSFSFVKGDVPEMVGNFTAAAKRGIVTLEWTRPQSGDVKNYRVFRDDNLIAEVTSEGYVDKSLTNTYAEYKVDVCYANGLYSPFVSAEVRVPESRVESAEAYSADGALVLEWDLNSMLSRTSLELLDENVKHVYVEGDELDFAQRFNASDLRTYVGYQISKVAFLPFTSQKLTKYELRVWRAPEGTDEFEIVTTRDASEYASGMWRDMMLKTPVEIEAGYDYMIGFHATSTINTWTVVCDGQAYNPGLGNLVMEDGVWYDDRLDSNVFLRATLEASTVKPEFVENEQPQFSEDFDPVNDTCYPLGFNVYRDGEYIGFTSSRSFKDANATAGSHTYGIACLYEGNNESRIFEKRFDYSGVEGVDVDEVPVQLVANEGALDVTARENVTLEIFSVDGRLLLQQPVAAGHSVIEFAGTGVHVVVVKNEKFVLTNKFVF